MNEANLVADRFGFVVFCEGYVLLRKRQDPHSEWVFPRYPVTTKQARAYDAAHCFVNDIHLTCSSMVALPGTYIGNGTATIFCRIDAESLAYVPVWPDSYFFGDSKDFGGVSATWVPIPEAQRLISTAQDPKDRTRDLTALGLALAAATEPKPTPLALGHTHSFLLEHRTDPTQSILVDSIASHPIQVPFTFDETGRGSFELAKRIIAQAKHLGLDIRCCYTCVSFTSWWMSGEDGKGQCAAAQDTDFKTQEVRHFIWPRCITDGLDSCGRWQKAPGFD